jgi:predicted RNA binding protein YcfA (HicA-like mRNA interferase family)
MMKRTELLKRLAEIGTLELVREGANHSLYRVNGNVVTVPRHREIGEGLSKAILKQARGNG